MTETTADRIQLWTRRLRRLLLMVRCVFAGHDYGWRAGPGDTRMTEIEDIWANLRALGEPWCLRCGKDLWTALPLHARVRYAAADWMRAGLWTGYFAALTITSLIDAVRHTRDAGADQDALMVDWTVTAIAFTVAAVLLVHARGRGRDFHHLMDVHRIRH